MTLELGNLTPELAAIQVEVEQYAHDYGLDFFPTIFELIEADQLNAIAARGGFPTRYPHWRFGMEFEQLHKGYQYGLQKIYEMVINNNPCYAYLMRCNATIDQKMVMAHVYGHCDFFKNNEWFSQTSRKMMDEMANHGSRVRRHMEEVGVSEVEDFIDACLSIEDLIDVHSPFIKRRDENSRYDFPDGIDKPEKQRSPKLPAKSYMDSFINPRERSVPVDEEVEQLVKRGGFPIRSERDVMLFLLEHAPLKPWQADVLSIIRDEAYYFAPQGQTKIMNEGWASFWHSTIMIHQGLSGADIINYCDHHSGTMASAPMQLNPYKVGIELFRNIEDRWNRGAFGREYDACDNFLQRKHWDTGAMLGREKIFEVRRIHNDLTFIDEFMTLDFVREHKFFQFGYNEYSEVYEIESREFPKIKHQLLESLTNRGQPIICVTDGNYRNRGELLLEHQYAGVELQLEFARDTLENLHRLWGRPVLLSTALEEAEVLLSYDGLEHRQEQGRPTDSSDGNEDGDSKTDSSEGAA